MRTIFEFEYRLIPEGYFVDRRLKSARDNIVNVSLDKLQIDMKT